MAGRIIVPTADTSESPGRRRPAGVFFCQDVPRTDGKISIAEQFRTTMDAVCSHAKRQPVSCPSSGDGAENLPDQLRGGCVVEERVRAVGGDQRDAQGLKLGEPGLLDHQVAGEPAGGFDDDDPGAVASQYTQAWP